MKRFQIISVAVLFLALSVFVPKIRAEESAVAPIVIPMETNFQQIKVNEIEKDILKDNLNLPKEVYAIPERPHYFLGLNQIPEVSYERLLEIRKLYQMKGSFYNCNGSITIDKSAQELGLHRNANYLQLTSDIEVAGRKVLVIFPYHLLSDPVNKEFIYMSPLGPKNLAEFSPLSRKYEIQWGLGQVSDEKWTAVKRALGWAQFQAVKHHAFSSLEEAIENNVAVHYELPARILEVQEKILDNSKVDEDLSKPVRGTEFQVQDMLMFPHVGPEDFVPDIYIVGPIPGAWGMANWKVIGSERIVFYDTLGSAYDFIINKTAILTHEIGHTNPYLQGLPATLYFDLEVWNTLATDLFLDDFQWFGSGYLPAVQDTIHTFFGYDSREAEKRIWPNRFVNLRDFNRKEFDENAKRVAEIMATLRKFIVEDFFPNFFHDQYFWLSVNTKWCDTIAAWRIMMVFKFEPTCIFDPQKVDAEGNPIPASVQTKQWLAEQEAAGRIKELAEETVKKTGELTDLGQKMSKIEDYAGLVKCPTNSGLFLLPPSEKKTVQAMLEQLLEENDPRFLRAIGYLLRLRGK
jgi:hypothetical protein